MKKIEELKQGDEIFKVTTRDIFCYRYFCLHPYNEKYHILIDNNSNPVRMYFKELDELLSKNIPTYHYARLKLIENLKMDIEYLEGDIEFNLFKKNVT